jgi:integrase/recombinase XerD
VARKLKVNLTKCVFTAKGLRYCPAVISTNGRIKPEIVVVEGKEERHAEGSYYLDWNENGKRIRQSVGKNAADAYTQYQRKTFSSMLRFMVWTSCLRRMGASPSP